MGLLTYFVILSIESQNTIRTRIFYRAEKNGVFFLRRVELWIIDFRSETAELALPEKFAASGGACGGLTTACGSNLNPAEQRVVRRLPHL